ncbi:MAG TPA: response regulator [Herpetosiphonaceae bacterium]
MMGDGLCDLKDIDRITVLLIDDNPGFRRIAERLLAEHYAREIAVLGATSIGQDGLRLVDSLHPQIILVGMGLPVSAGLAFVQALRVGGWRMGIVGLGLLATTSYEQAVRSAGADAFVPKDDLNTRLLVTLREVMRLRSELA